MGAEIERGDLGGRGDPVQQLLTELGWRFDLHSVAELGCGVPEGGHVRLAGVADDKVGLEGSQLLAVEGVESVDRREVVEGEVVIAHEVTSSARRSRTIPSRIRVLIVPSGAPSATATWR